MMLKFPDQMSVSRFLDEYWQNFPLLIHQGLDIREIPDISVLFQLAGVENMESRIVNKLGDAPFWQLFHGPFEQDFISQLGNEGWTLLLQDMDKFLPSMQQLIDNFRFIPDWRIDDVMISYAVNQGSVGPHTDEYDVFLVQLAGKRRWRISTQPVNDDDLLPDLDLRILAKFEAEQEWLLDRGDILYLPPGIAHWGIAEGECITASVGFRAPSTHDLLQAWVEHLLETTREKRFQDQRPRPLQSHPAEISKSDANALMTLLQDTLLQDDKTLPHWLGSYLSEPKPHLYPAFPEDVFNRGKVIKRGIELHPASRLLYQTQDEASILYANGVAYQLPGLLHPLIEQLTTQRRLNANQLETWLDKEAVMELFENLFMQGVIHYHAD